jgi:hypothetical protein
MNKNKYKAVKTVIDGMTFDSKAEARRYTILRLLERQGLIKDLETQPKFLLLEGFKKSGKTFRGINYKADFRYWDCTNECVVIEDVKGMETDVFKIKRKLFEYKYPELTLMIVK